MNPITPIVVLTFTLQSILPAGYSLTRTPQAAQVLSSTLPAAPQSGANGGINSASDLRSSLPLIRKSRPHLQYSYTYDPAGNRLTMTAPNGIHNYTYNNIYELTNVTGAQVHNFVYDKLGNRTLADTINYTANNLNQYTQVSVNPYKYDGNGNFIDDNHATYAYDAENRMTVSTNQPYTTYQYDGLGRRILKNIDNDRLTYYVYDGDRIIEERYDNGSLAASYVYGDGIDEVLTMNRNNQTFYYFMDGLGSVTDIANENGEVVENYTYDVYGAPNHTSSIGNPYMFTGRQYDDESGLYYYRRRYYEPIIGRFLSRDPLSSRLNLTLSPNAFQRPLLKAINEANPYLYTGNNPFNRIDPFGLWYVDLNVSGGWWGGVTAGIIVDSQGIYGYGGGGFVTPGAGVSLTRSPQDVSSGWNVGGQITIGIAGQYGYSYKDKSDFWEAGAGWLPGASVTWYYVSNPWKWPWKAKEKSCGEGDKK